jgi:heat shock protein HtpX
MATLYTHQSSNVQKTWLLMSVFFIIIIALGWFFSYYYNSPIILVVAVAFSIVMNITSYWFSDKLVLSMYKAQPVTNESHPDLYNIVENLAITAGLPMPKVYVIPEMSPNAFATGRNKEHAAVAVTEGLLRALDRTELEGVIAHELAHIGNRDILLQTVVVVLVGIITLIADFFLRIGMVGGGRSSDDSRGNILLLVLGLAAAIIAPIAAVLLQLAISRRREFLADATGALLTRYPEGLASALEKIHAYTAQVPMKHANHATAHMFIANPFGRGGAINKLFQTHPPVEERVRVLREMSQ